jgi:hypothetical protein
MEGGFRIAHKRGYLISPNHIRFGLPPLSAGFLDHIPFVGEVFCTGVAYHLIPHA